MIRIKRVYDPPDRSDGVRILVDRLWPRGLEKDAAGKAGELKLLGRRARRGTVALLYAARDETHNNALVLKEIVEDLQRRSA